MRTKLGTAEICLDNDENCLDNDEFGGKTRISVFWISEFEDNPNSFHVAFFQKAVAKISPFDQPVQQERFLRQGLVPTVVGHSMVQALGDRLHEREQHELLVIGFTRTHTHTDNSFHFSWSGLSSLQVFSRILHGCEPARNYRAFVEGGHDLDLSIVTLDRRFLAGPPRETRVTLALGFVLRGWTDSWYEDLT